MSACYRLPTLLSIVATMFTEAWQISAFTDGSKAGREAFFSRVFGIYQGIMFMAAAGIIWLCQPIMRVYVGKEFFSAWEFVPLFTFATIFSSLSNFQNSIYMLEMKSGLSLLTMAVGAVLNLILNAAPEIANSWDIALMPGYENDDGEVERWSAGGAESNFIFSDSDKKDEAWEFLKWWTDKDTQLAFGRELESVLGEAARYPTANIEALAELPWPVDDYSNLESQWQWVEGTPQVLGGYFTGRHLDNAFRRVVNANENPREALQDHVRYINDEMEIKREEFKLSN